MTIDLPPRRRLPADVRERMRPDFTEVRSRRDHTPLAVAAGVALLIASGIAITQSVVDRTPAPGRGDVHTPSSQDLSRCRAALNDPNWSSTEMVVFGLQKVLVGENSRFCELAASTAGVAAPDARPVQLEAGSITYRSGQIIAGVPPLGALTARAREVSTSHSRASSAAVVTPDFFVIHTPVPLTVTELVFDNRTVPLPAGAVLPAAATFDSFESGNADPWTPANIVARCADNAYANGTRAEDLRGWEPLISAQGILVAHRDHREWATCTFTTGPETLQPRPGLPAGENKPAIVSGAIGDAGFLMVGRTSRDAKTVELRGASTPAQTVNVTEGFFVAALPQVTGLTDPRAIQVTVRDAKNAVVYEGPMG
ncbi:hypothetical protein GCM10022267_12190 [Lentzea roselyniae]|uniref:Uncharacterized protein n=1 Tax=Lentzea roselyniae TaxID=531940 RepID=A0ABP7A9I8_9PSEU